MSGNLSITVILDPDAGSGGETVAGFLRDRLPGALAEVSRPVGNCGVRIVGDAAMSELHARHLGIPGPTDVLTFDASLPGAPIEVDIVVCLPEARRACEGTTVSVEHEVLLYAVHGVLHCAGLTDADEASSSAMRAEEARILTAIGLGDVFSTGMEAP
ncbi:MAG: rRNA maturation RNase YbeY [Planctomycetota bacterium]|nr:rRNA maturation RNase YbeY [Planctomycetota bacterium]MDA1105563.1 rRNA maturation RNase YbeY [Planctomycetota bacterium]